MSLTEVFGLGDVLFLLTLTPALLAQQYVFTVLIASILGIMGTTFYKHQNGIPFVTYASIPFFCFHFLNLVEALK